eukprot:1665060-Amphidinium_carterae.1
MLLNAWHLFSPAPKNRALLCAEALVRLARISPTFCLEDVLGSYLSSCKHLGGTSCMGDMPRRNVCGVQLVRELVG